MLGQHRASGQTWPNLGRTLQNAGPIFAPIRPNLVGAGLARTPSLTARLARVRARSGFDTRWGDFNRFFGPRLESRPNVPHGNPRWHRTEHILEATALVSGGQDQRERPTPRASGGQLWRSIRAAGSSGRLRRPTPEVNSGGQLRRSNGLLRCCAQHVVSVEGWSCLRGAMRRGPVFESRGLWGHGEVRSRGAEE